MTSKIRFRGATSGFVELAAPDAAGNNTLVLPSGTGASGDFLRTDGSGSLSFAAVTDTGFESYAVICDQKTQDTDGGAFTNGAWRTRDLNTEILDPDSIVTISGNQFILPDAGSYLIEWFAPASSVGTHRARLFDVTGATAVQVGGNAQSTSTGGYSYSFGSARVTPTSSNVYRIEHRCEDGTASALGFGYRSNVDVEIYTVVRIFKEA